MAVALVRRALTSVQPAANAFLRSAKYVTEVADPRPLTWVFLGPPGVGKGTYSAKVAAVYGLSHIAAGDLVREEIKRKSEIGKTMQEIVERGELLPDALILRVLRRKFMRAAAEGVDHFLLDGFPRTIEQAESLDQIANVQLALNLDLREEVLVEKCMGRRICTQCGKNYNIANIYLSASGDLPEIVMPPLDPPATCLPHLEQRSDDREETIRRRLEIYHSMSDPVENYYKTRNLLVDFEITGGIPQTLPRLLDVLKPYRASATSHTA